MRIEVSDLHRSFGDNHVLRGVNLTVPERGITAIVGGSGCGKSVLLKHFNGLLKPDHGQILIDGQDITHLSEHGLAPVRRRFGMVFQGGALLNSLTVAENLALSVAEQPNGRAASLAQQIEEKLALVGLAGKQREMPANLSGGMRKRVAIARALMMDPEVFLYDEPTTGLDPPMSDVIDDLIAELAEKFHRTTVVVTHDLVSIFRIAHTVAMLHEGRIIFHGTPNQMRADSNEAVQRFIARGVTGTSQSSPPA